MAKEVSIIVAVKNAVQVGLSKAMKEFNDFGQHVANVGKIFATAFLAAGTAVAGFVTKALASWAQAEAAQNALQASFRAFGEEVNVNTERVLQFTAAIQDETGVSDDNLVARAAKLKTLGVETQNLEAATKATVALASAGMDEEAATKAVAMAYAGNFSMLQRYIPGLKDAKTESQKLQLVNEFLTRAYEIQKDKLNSVSGQWGLLKERLGDAWEEAGKTISQNDLLAKGISKVSETVKMLTDQFRELSESGGIERLVATFKIFFEDLKYRFLLLSNDAAITWTTIGDALSTAGSYMSGVWNAFVAMCVEQLYYLRDVAVAVWEAIKHPFAEGFVPPDTSAFRKSISDLGDAIIGKNVEVRDNTKALLADASLLHEEHAARVAQIATEQADAQIAQIERQAQVEKDRLDASVANAEAAADAKIAASDRVTVAVCKNEQLQNDADQAAWEKSLIPKATGSKNGITNGRKFNNGQAFNAGNWLGGGPGDLLTVKQSTAITGTGRTSGSMTDSGVGFSSVGAFSGNGKYYVGSYMDTSTGYNSQILGELKKQNSNLDKLLRYN